MLEEQEVGLIGAEHEAAGRQPHRHDRLTRRQAGQPRVPGRAGCVVSQERHTDRQVFGEQLGAAGSAGFLQQQHPVDLVETEATGGFGGGEAGHARLGEGRPQPGHPAGLVLPGISHRGRRAPVGEDRAHGVTEEELVFGEGELHERYFRGRPSSRSEMMLRWISLVPA